jgi:hypothetical protein
MLAGNDDSGVIVVEEVEAGGGVEIIVVNLLSDLYNR